MKAIYKFYLDCGRQGYLEGVFIRDKAEVETLLKLGIKVYFGEALGKHSEIVAKIKSEQLTFITDDPIVVELFYKYELNSGFNPFDYYSYDFDFVEFDMEENFDLTVGEIVDIIIQNKKVIND